MSLIDTYLQSSKYIDHHDPAVTAKAKDLARGLDDHMAITAACFTFVRDQIAHSWDHQRNPVASTTF